jgi:hypothetical protein
VDWNWNTVFAVKGELMLKRPDLQGEYAPPKSVISLYWVADQIRGCSQYPYDDPDTIPPVPPCRPTIG